MSREHLAVCLALICAVGASAAPSFAQDRERATRLFHEAKTLMDDNHHDEACPKLEEAKRLEPSGGIVLALAICHEKIGRGATALAEFIEARNIAERGGRADRQKLASERIQVLESSVSRITIVVPPSADAEGLVVTLDNATIERALFGAARPVDAGAHVVRAVLPDGRQWETSVRVNATGDSARAEIPPWPAAHSTTTNRPTPAVRPIASSSTATSPTTDSTDPGKGRRTLGLAFGGVGVVSIGIGSFFGVRALSRRSDAEAKCGGAATCPDDAVTLDHDARGDAMVSTVMIGAGIVAAGIGGFFFFTAPSSDRGKSASQGTRLVVVPGVGGALLRGTF